RAPQRHSPLHPAPRKNAASPPPFATPSEETMDRDQLRAAQAPLKQRYREEPSAALVTLRARGTLGDGVSCSIQTGRALAEAGLHPATGGDGSLLLSGDLLLE